MQYGKAITAQAYLHDNSECNDAFSELLSRIEALSHEERGAKALKLSAQLLEIAAFELAGSLKSAEIGEMIECSARMMEQSSDITVSDLTVKESRQAVVQ